jgi:hypothetical protein
MPLPVAAFDASHKQTVRVFNCIRWCTTGPMTTRCRPGMPIRVYWSKGRLTGSTFILSARPSASLVTGAAAGLGTATGVRATQALVGSAQLETIARINKTAGQREATDCR